MGEEPSVGVLPEERTEGERYWGVLVSKVYRGESVEEVRRRTPKHKPGKTRADCERLCEDHGVSLNNVEDFLVHGEDWALLYIHDPKENGDARPWVLCTYHLGEARTPPWKHYAALELLFRNHLKKPDS